MSLRLSLAVQLLHRPHLITPAAALEIAQRIRSLDPRAFERHAGPFALLRKVGLMGKKPRALEGDDEHMEMPVPTRPGAYAPVWMGDPDTTLEWGWSVKDGIAMMEIRGPLAERGEYFCGEWIHGYDTIAAAIDEADNNGAVKAMLIRFDTPGGVVASGLDDLSAQLNSRGPDAKPLWAHCEMACSAGYWIASQFDNVLAPKAGLVGSIGAVLVHEDYSGALEKAGIAITSIEFPAGGQKTEGAWWKALSEEGLADLQAMIDHAGEAFLAAVHSGRGELLTPEKARGLKARVFTADHSDKSRAALSLGLIDGVMSEREAFDALLAETRAAMLQPVPAKPAGQKSGAVKTASKPAASAAVNPPPAASAAVNPKEQTMALKTADAKLRNRIAALVRKAEEGGEDEETLSQKIRKLLDEEDEQTAEGEEEETAEGEDEDTAAEGEGDEPEAEGEEEDEPAANTQFTRAMAIIDLPEARGREGLARKLAADPKVSVSRAKELLAASPKASRLSDRVTDPKLSADGGKQTTEARRHADEALAVAGLARKSK